MSLLTEPGTDYERNKKGQFTSGGYITKENAREMQQRGAAAKRRKGQDVLLKVLAEDMGYGDWDKGYAKFGEVLRDIVEGKPRIENGKEVFPRHADQIKAMEVFAKLSGIETAEGREPQVSVNVSANADNLTDDQIDALLGLAEEARKNPEIIEAEFTDEHEIEDR